MAGARLAQAVVAAVPGWVRQLVQSLLEAWQQAGGEPTEGSPAASAVLDRADEAGEFAAAMLEGELGRLLGADVDDQWTTPLALVRQVVSYPTSVLSEAGVPPVDRDRFVEQRFPDDPYGLTPASLGVLGPEVAEQAMAWGLAKAVAHRSRHRGSGTRPG